MRAQVEMLLSRYGMDMTVDGKGGSRIVRGFFRAVHSQSWQRAEVAAGPLGEVPRGQYVYLGPVSAKVKEGDTVRFKEENYVLRRVETYYFGNAPIYQWALAVREGEERQWGL